jgi:hypothetical protein
LKGEISWVITSSHFEPMTKAGHISSNQPTCLQAKRKKRKIENKIQPTFSLTHFVNEIQEECEQ